MATILDAALDDLIARVRAHYGTRTGAIFRVDRTRHMEELDQSDAEIVVLIADGAWRSIDEHRNLAKLTFDTLMEHEVYIRAWPVPASAWLDPAQAEHPHLVREFQSTAQVLLAAA